MSEHYEFCDDDIIDYVLGRATPRVAQYISDAARIDLELQAKIEVLEAIADTWPTSVALSNSSNRTRYTRRVLVALAATIVLMVCLYFWDQTTHPKVASVRFAYRQNLGMPSDDSLIPANDGQVVLDNDVFELLIESPLSGYLTVIQITGFDTGVFPETHQASIAELPKRPNTELRRFGPLLISARRSTLLVAVTSRPPSEEFRNTAKQFDVSLRGVNELEDALKLALKSSGNPPKTWNRYHLVRGFTE